MAPGPELHADRARRGWAALLRSFRTPGGLLRGDGRLRLPGSVAHLWPFTGALSAALALAHLDGPGELGWLLEALERYWQPDRPVPAYASDVVVGRPRWRRAAGGDLYYDDNAWVGLALARLERIRPGLARMEGAVAAWRFAQSGWDAARGGVHWVEQGRGVGARNHDRNLVSTAPNAALGLHLVELGAVPPSQMGEPSPEAMYEWVLAVLDAGGAAGDPGAGPYWDKVKGDGSLDRSVWSYNPGTMVALNLLLARTRRPGTRTAAGEAGPDSGVGAGERYRRRAEAIAREALRRWRSGEFAAQPAAFNAILFRNLLMLGPEHPLAGEIRASLQGYADHLWHACRDGDDRFRPTGGATTLLDQSAAVELHALLTWPPADHHLLS